MAAPAFPSTPAAPDRSNPSQINNRLDNLAISLGGVPGQWRLIQAYLETLVATKTPKWAAGAYSENDPVYSPTDFLTYRSRIDTTALEAVAAFLADPDAWFTAEGITAVDWFLYDTRNDSDGGMWRFDSSLSWYTETLNTATRGATRPFPALALIVAEADTVTIFDCEDASLPMWMVFPSGVLAYSGGVLTVQIHQGFLCIGAANGIFEIPFITDEMQFRQTGQIRAQNLISTRGSAAMMTTPRVGYLPGSNVNDIAMTILDDAPIDPDTGLKVPTIAVATDGGVSVIKDDGTVVDLMTSNGEMHAVSFDVDNRLFITGGQTIAYMNWVFNSIPLSDSDAFDFRFNQGSTPARLGTNGSTGAAESNASVGGCWALGTLYQGLQLLDYDPETPANGSVAYITTEYNTGYMFGDIAGAFLASTDDSDLVGSGELVTNGDFAADSDWTKGTGWAIGSGAATKSPGSSAYLSQASALTSGLTFVFEFTISGRTAGNAHARLENATAPVRNADGTYFETITTDSANPRIIISADSAFDGSIDNISVKLADPDRSHNGNGLIVNGTWTREVVADGAELVWTTLGADSTVTLSTDISASGMVTWWEKVGGVPVRYDKDLSGGTSYVNGVPGTPPTTSITFSGADMTLKAGKPMALVRPSGTIASAADVSVQYAAELPLFQPDAKAVLQGTSDAVERLDSVPVTGHLLVRTDDGVTTNFGNGSLAPVPVSLADLGLSLDPSVSRLLWQLTLGMLPSDKAKLDLLTVPSAVNLNNLRRGKFRTADGAGSAGDVVARQSDGTIKVVTTGNANADDWLGFVASDFVDAASVRVLGCGDIVTGLTGLTYGETHYLDGDGSLTISAVGGRKVGLALSTTDLLITEING